MDFLVGLKYAKNALAAGALPRTPLGELMTLPQLVGRGRHPLPMRLDSCAFGASILVPPPPPCGILVPPAALELATVLGHTNLEFGQNFTQATLT